MSNDLPTLRDSPLALLETAHDIRQEARLPAGYEPGVRVPYDPRLCYELALDLYPADEVFTRHGVAQDKAIALLQYPPFVAQCKRYKAEILEQGVSFKLKARVQAEDLLNHSYDLATDPETPASVRADLIQWTAAVAGLGPKDKGGGAGAAGSGGFTLNVIFPGGEGGARGPDPVSAAIDVTPAVIAP